MTDAELFARAALLMARVVEATGENDFRRIDGSSPAYRDGCPVDPQLSHEISEELKSREELKRGLEKSEDGIKVEITERSKTVTRLMDKELGETIRRIVMG